jgi:hypothetical protein
MPISTINQNGLNAPLSLTAPNLGTPSAINLTNATGLSRAALPTGSVLQVVSTTKTDTFTTTSTTDVEITGLSATITPTSSTSKIVVLVNIGASGTTTGDYALFLSLYRSASLITGSVGASPSSRKACTSASRNSSSGRFQSSSIMYYDSPASTSSLTYACYISMESGGGSACINRSASDGDQASSPRTVSTITLMEISA